MEWLDFVEVIEASLSDDLLTPAFRAFKKRTGTSSNVFGHCYVASEAAYHLLGGKEGGWKPQYVKHLGCPHWFLKHESGAILDITASQFRSPVSYDKARGIGFLTKAPSKRAKLLIKKIGQHPLWQFIKTQDKSHGKHCGSGSGLGR
jgi:hypothetical protein